MPQEADKHSISLTYVKKLVEFQIYVYQEVYKLPFTCGRLKK